MAKRLGPRKRKGDVNELTISIGDCWVEFWGQVKLLRPAAIEDLEALAPSYNRCRDAGEAHHLGGPFPDSEWWRGFSAGWAGRWNLTPPQVLQLARQHLENLRDVNAEALSNVAMREREPAGSAQTSVQGIGVIGYGLLPPPESRTVEECDMAVSAAQQFGEPVLYFQEVWDPRYEAKTAARERMKSRFGKELTSYLRRVGEYYDSPDEPLIVITTERLGWLVRRIVPSVAGGNIESFREISGIGGIPASADGKGDATAEVHRKVHELASNLGICGLLPHRDGQKPSWPGSDA